MNLPAIVADARRRADDAGFALSSEPEVGALLSSLAAGVATNGRILELGTGVGCGLAWFVHALGDRTEVEVVTVEVDELLASHTRSVPWPSYVAFERGEGAALLPTLGTFDLIFADAPGGKTTGLELTIDALRPGGMLVIDDMDLGRHEDSALRLALADVRRNLLADEGLVCSELAFSSGVIVAARRRGPTLG